MLVFNGEIYNHLELRRQLACTGEEPAWRGSSDTETLLAGFDAWGVLATLERATGMFALAVWDRELSRLMLARDRMGEKPMYYGWQGQGAEAVFLFGSELKALRAHPGMAGEIDRTALGLQLRLSYIPAGRSIYAGIAKLAPGCLLTLSLSAPTPAIEPYWDALNAIEAARASPWRGTEEQAEAALEALLKSVVHQQMVADVPLGAFLSGGIDSSLIVAMMQSQSARPVRTFSIGFHEDSYNEAQHAARVARHLGTDHTELYISGADAMAVIPRLPTLYDEPFSDSSQIPTFLVAQMARQQVTVALSGDGGDELFGGYERYGRTAGMWRRMRQTPLPARRMASAALHAAPGWLWDCMDDVARAGDNGARFGSLRQKADKVARMLRQESPESFYGLSLSHWQDPAAIVAGIGPCQDALAGADAVLLRRLAALSLDPVERMMVLDMLVSLSDDILVKVDRAAMSVSLETRVPLLDHRVVEFAWRLPAQMKMRDGQGKRILRRLLGRHVPAHLTERPKQGFGVPIGDWLRGPLRDWAEALLAPERLRREGLLHAGPVVARWQEHLSGRRNWQYHLWDVLMFQSWLEHQSAEAPGAAPSYRSAA